MKLPFTTTCLLATLSLAAPAFAQALSDNNQAVMSARQALDKAEADVQESEKLLEDRQARLEKTSGMAAATPEAIRQLADHLQTEKEALEVETAGAKGREDAITRAIDQTTTRVRDRADSDEVTKQMEAVVVARQAAVNTLRNLQNAGAAPKGEVEAAQAELATARASLAAARQKIAAPSTDLLEALNRELINLTISRQERSTKLEYINHRLQQLAPALTEARNLERALHQLQRAEHRRDSAMDQLLTTQRSGH